MGNSTSRHVAVLASGLGLWAFAVSAALLPALLLRVSVDFGVSAEVLSWVVATQFGCCFAAAMVGGVLSDHYGKKPVLLTAGALLTIGSLLWGSSTQLVTAHIAAALMGMGGGILEALGSALLIELYPQRRTLVLNLSQMVYCAGAVAGPLIVTLFISYGLDWRTVFFAEAGVGCAIIMLYCCAYVPPRVSESTEGCLAGFQVLKNRAVMLFAVALLLYVLVESVLAVYLNLHLQRHHGAPERWAVLGISAFWAAMLIGRLVCALIPNTVPAFRLICLFVVSGAVVLGAQALVSDWRASFLLFSLAGFLLAGLWPAIVALAAHIDPQRSGSVIGSVIAIGSLGALHLKDECGCHRTKYVRQHPHYCAGR